MRDRYLRSIITVSIAAAAVGAVISMSMTQTSGQAPAARPASVGGKPNFSGIWQANNEANWDLQAHAARPAAVTQPGFTLMTMRGCRRRRFSRSVPRVAYPDRLASCRATGRFPTSQRPWRSRRRTRNTGLTATRN